jgi:acyl-coenzyme A thioesterase PaaI-like protein
MPNPVAIQDRYPPDFAHCYGCGRSNQHGHQLKSFWSGDEVVAHFQPKPHHIAVPGFVYGGLVASLIDCHAMATAAAFAERAAGPVDEEQPAPRYVTAALNVQYLKPTPVGHELVLRARVGEANERKSRVSVTVEANGIVTVKGDAIAVPIPESMSSA